MEERIIVSGHPNLRSTVVTGKQDLGPVFFTNGQTLPLPAGTQKIKRWSNLFPKNNPLVFRGFIVNFEVS